MLNISYVGVFAYVLITALFICLWIMSKYKMAYAKWMVIDSTVLK